MYQNNSEGKKTYSSEYYHANKEAAKNRALKYKFNITLDEYNVMLSEQEGKCAICKRHEDELDRKLSVDHCHTTNFIRGLLCNDCNRGIALLHDNPNIAMAAAFYLDEWAFDEGIN